HPGTRGPDVQFLLFLLLPRRAARRVGGALAGVPDRVPAHGGGDRDSRVHRLSESAEAAGAEQDDRLAQADRIGPAEPRRRARRPCSPIRPLTPSCPSPTRPRCDIPARGRTATSTPTASVSMPSKPARTTPAHRWCCSYTDSPTCGGRGAIN